MESAIYNYPIEWAHENRIELPTNSEFLSMHVWNGKPTLWYKHNPINVAKRTVTIIMRATGKNLSSELFPGEDFITTLLFYKDGEVYHFFFKH